MAILEQRAIEHGKDYKRLARMSLQEILADLTSGDKHLQAIALDAFAFYFCRTLDLAMSTYQARNAGEELLVRFRADTARLASSRWAICCISGIRLSADDVATEVGLAIAYRAQVLILITSGYLDPSTISFARRAMNCAALRIVLLDGTCLRELRRHMTLKGLLRSLDAGVLVRAA